MNDFLGVSESYLDEYILQGGLTMLVLIPLSIYTLALMVQRTLDLRRERVMASWIIEAIKTKHSPESLKAFRTRLDSDSSPLAEIVTGYLEAAERGEPLNPDVNPGPLDDVMDRLYQSLTPLSTAYVIAPLIGVLGTTIGIMGTFEQFAIVGKRDMSALVSAIDKSLITTMWGLIIAVPAYFSYSLFQNRVFQFERRELPRLLKKLHPELKGLVSLDRSSKAP